MSPPASMPGVCWGHIPGLQITEIVSDIVLATPAVVDEFGRETSPAIYRKVTRPQTFNEGDGRWFQQLGLIAVQIDLPDEEDTNDS